MLKTLEKIIYLTPPYASRIFSSHLSAGESSHASIYNFYTCHRTNTFSLPYIPWGGKISVNRSNVTLQVASSEGSSSLMDKVIFRFILPSQMSKLNRSYSATFPLHITTIHLISSRILEDISRNNSLFFIHFIFNIIWTKKVKTL